MLNVYMLKTFHFLCLHRIKWGFYKHVMHIKYKLNV